VVQKEANVNIDSDVLAQPHEILSKDGAFGIELNPDRRWRS
jgi:hypothetical protein